MPVDKESVIYALESMGFRARTDKEARALMDACKNLNLDISMSRLCEDDIHEVMQLAREKLASTQLMSVRRDGLKEDDAVEFVKTMVANRAEYQDVDQLESEAEDLVQRYRPPGVEIFGASELVLLQQKVDVKADEYRRQRDRQRERLSTPQPKVVYPKAQREGNSHLPEGYRQVPELQAYRQMCKTPLPAKPRPFVAPVVPPPKPEYGAIYLRESKDEITRTKSEPQIPRPYPRHSRELRNGSTRLPVQIPMHHPRVPISTMKVSATREPQGFASAPGQASASTRTMPYLPSCRSELPIKEVQTPSGLSTVPDSMFKQYQQARMVAAGRQCLRYHHHSMRGFDSDQAKTADTRRENMKLVRKVKKEEWDRMHPPINPVATTFVDMEPATVLGKAVSYIDVYPPPSGQTSECSSEYN